MNAGDLTPNMIGKQRIRISFGGTTAEGMLTGLEIRTDTQDIWGGAYARIHRVTDDVSLGVYLDGTCIDPVPLDADTTIIKEAHQ